jgi:NADH dehydrogenase [ubiquinone] 1 alpha subcomplex assembly factor 7
MSELARHIARLIKETGPLPLSQYMALVLGHPRLGYYMTRDPLGAKGDFITAPGISQMFGELTALWLAEQWLSQGSPKRIALAELGPGRGTLMQDALRALRSIPGLLEAAEIHLVETSPALRAAQATRLPGATWHDSIDKLPRLPLFLIANEFFDALPVSQFEKTERGWCERYVALADGASIETPRFAPVLAPEPLASTSLAAHLQDARTGSIFEASPASTSIAHALGQRIAHDGGAALIIDYGHAQSGMGDTFQAMRAHGFVNPYESPGEADLTAHVDFAALAAACCAGGAAAHGPVEQGAFLRVIGIEARAARLKQSASPEMAQLIDSQLARLTGRDEMGRLFKILALTPKAAPRPSGFQE